jgi:tetratricopeptide (TPR) repeat protein
VLIFVALFSTACSSVQKKYSTAIKLYEISEYEQAITAFTNLGDYKDSYLYLLRSRYEYAHKLMKEGDYESAVTIFEELSELEVLDSTQQLLDCRYQYAKQLALKGEYVRAKTLFSTLGEFSDSKKQIDLINVEINKLSEHDFKEKVVSEEYFMFYGNWKGEKGFEGFYTFLPKNKCRILDDLSIDKQLNEYDTLKWDFVEGYIKIYEKENLVADLAVTKLTENEMEGYDFVSHKEFVFERNDVNSLNAELDYGIQFGMTKTTIKRLDPNSQKAEAKRFLQCAVYIKGENRSFNGTRTYYFNSKGKLCKITTALDAISTGTLEENYTELSKHLNTCFNNISCCDTGSENVKFGNGSYYESINSISDTQIHFWATKSGGMLWVVSDKYSE